MRLSSDECCGKSAHLLLVYTKYGCRKDSGRNIDFKHRWIRKHGHLKETYAASTKISYIKYFKQKCAVLLYTASKVSFNR